MATVYTHLKKRYVRMGNQNVKKGEKRVAVAGAEKMMTATLYELKFEVRLKGNARNPLFFLPYIFLLLP